MKGCGQGGSIRDTSGARLRSDNHITCYNVILLNLETRETMMAHVWEGGYGGFSDRQYADLHAFCKPLGEKVAIITEGARSTPNGVKYELKRLGITVLNIRVLPTGGKRWGALFDPQERHLTIEDEDGKAFFSDVVFPPYQDVPERERGLDDRQRLEQRLAKYADAKGNLPRPALEILGRLLKETPMPRESTPVSSVLLSDFIRARAKAAGFDDSSDYLEADRKNFVAIAPGSPEITLRHILGVPDNVRERFRKAGINFKKLEVTPGDVVALLADHPRITLLFLERLAASASPPPAATPGSKPINA